MADVILRTQEDVDRFEASQRSAIGDLHRRVKVVRLSSCQVLDWFASAVNGWPRVVSLPVMEGLPKGVRVLSVNARFMHRTIDFLVAHESFEAVPEMEMPPQVGAGSLGTRYEVVTLPEVGKLIAAKKEHDGLWYASEVALSGRVFGWTRDRARAQVIDSALAERVSAAEGHGVTFPEVNGQRA